MTNTQIILLVVLPVISFLFGRTIGRAHSSEQVGALTAQLASAKEQVAQAAGATESQRDSFAKLAVDALRTNNEQFLQLAEERLKRQAELSEQGVAQREAAIAQMVAPIAQQLETVDKHIAEVERLRSVSYGALQEQVTSMASSNAQLQSETSNLVRALSSSTTRGQWGEMTLKRVVEMAGMQEYCDFDVQETHGAIRPDLIVNLPGGKRIIVDAKTVLDAYMTAVNTTDPVVRDAAYVNHARQVRTQIDALASKGYWEQFDEAPDVVVMFLPIESCFSAACHQDATLLEYAAGKKVMMASPMTLITMLRAVAYGWQQEKLAANAQQISELGRELHKRVAKLTEHFSRLGGRLDGAVDAYNEAIGTLERSILPQARRFTALGSGSGKPDETPDPIERRARNLSAPELKAGSATTDSVVGENSSEGDDDSPF